AIARGPPRDPLAGRDPAPGRHLGRATIHGHGLPVGLLHQLPPVPARVPADGARTVREMTTTVAEAPNYGAVMAQAQDENFPVALGLLGRREKQALMAIYGVARLIDDIGDEAAGNRGALLDWVDVELDRVYAGEPPEHP